MDNGEALIIVRDRLERWFDFYLNGEQLVLLSSAAVTQKIVRKVKKKWGQNIVSWIDLGTGTPTPRLIPLDERYLEAAMNAGKCPESGFRKAGLD